MIDWPPELESTPTVAWLRRHAGKARSMLRGHVSIRLAAATAGLGLSLFAHVSVPRDSRLVRLDVDPAPPALGLWLATHADLARLPRIRTVIDHIAAAAEARAGFLRDGLP
jgi:DNA-binding transcriptional LysR family regulator